MVESAPSFRNIADSNNNIERSYRKLIQRSLFLRPILNGVGHPLQLCNKFLKYLTG